MVAKVAEKLKASTKAFIVQAIRDIVGDPDFGFLLTQKAERRLKQAQQTKEKTVSLQDIKKKYC